LVWKNEKFTWCQKLDRIIILLEEIGRQPSLISKIIADIAPVAGILGILSVVDIIKAWLGG